MSNFFITPYCLKLIIFFTSLLFTSNLIAEQKPYAPESIQGVTIVSADEVVEMILTNPDLLIIDSRKAEEFKKGHIEGAVSLPNTNLMQEDIEKISADKSTTFLFYCNGIRCLRSSDSLYKAKAWGYTNLMWFRGGWNEWIENRLPVIMD